MNFLRNTAIFIEDGLEKPIDVAINVGFNEIKNGVHAIIG